MIQSPYKRQGYWDYEPCWRALLKILHLKTDLDFGGPQERPSRHPKMSNKSTFLTLSQKKGPLHPILGVSGPSSPVDFWKKNIRSSVKTSGIGAQKFRIDFSLKYFENYARINFWRGLFCASEGPKPPVLVLFCLILAWFCLIFESFLWVFGVSGHEKNAPVRHFFGGYAPLKINSPDGIRHTKKMGHFFELTWKLVRREFWWRISDDVTAKNTSSQQNEGNSRVKKITSSSKK